MNRQYMKGRQEHPESEIYMKHTPIVFFAGTILASAALASPVPPDYSFNWSTIGDAGNRATLDSEIFDPFDFFPNPHVGAVNYEFRMATTEVTVGQYFEFVQEYHPYFTANTGNVLGLSDFTGGLIRVAFGETHIRDGVSQNRAAQMGWEYAARYVNWLHNDKVNEEWAFETGVYDTSTFTQNPDGTYNHQETHNPDAKFWIPTRDEWTKAGYWDPELNDGEGGYWQFPDGSNTELIPGLERNAGQGDEFPLDVGSFPDITSPWGLMDLAGGVSEWSGSMVRGDPNQRYLLGTRYSTSNYGDFFADDLLGWGTGAQAGLSHGIPGLRLASSIPSPGVFMVMGFAQCLITRRKR